MLDSSSQQNFQESYSSFPVSLIENEQPSILDLSMEPLRESEQQSQNPMDSQFPKSTSILTFSRRTNCKKYERHDSDLFCYPAYQQVRLNNKQFDQ